MDPIPLAGVLVHSVLDHLRDSEIATAIDLFPTIVDQDHHRLPEDLQLFLPCLDPDQAVHLVALDPFDQLLDVLVHQMQDVQHPTVLLDKHKEVAETNVQVLQELEIPSEGLHPMQETDHLHLDQVQVLVQEEIGPVQDSSEVTIDPLLLEDPVMEMDPQGDPDLVMEMDPQADPDPVMEMDPQADQDLVMEMGQLVDLDQEVEMEDLDSEEVMDDQDLTKIFEVEDKGQDSQQDLVPVPVLVLVLLPEGVPVGSEDKIPGQAEIIALVIVLQLSHVQIPNVQQS